MASLDSRLVFASVALVLGVVATGCGGNDGATFSAPAPVPTTDTPPPVPTGTFQPPVITDAEAPPDDAGVIDCDADPAACLPPGVCGDGKPGLGESCDDGNIDNGDGCSDHCKIEAPFWACGFGLKCVDVRDCTALIEAGVTDGGDAGCVIPPKVPACGDGVLDDGEVCDDGNVDPGDGCSLDCKAKEANFECPTPGQLCVSTMKCGDGKITGSETCDDGQLVPTGGDGCSATCTLELGWTCPIPGAACQAALCGDGILAGDEECDDAKPAADLDGCSATCTLEKGWKCPPNTACTLTTCGDGILEGTEQCDDHNTRPYDGCSMECNVEPKCAGGVCTAVCGDGVKFPGEDCDDGNLRDGDGCNHLCKLEPGFLCSVVTSGLPTSIEIPIIYRDTTPALNPDFESWCCGSATGMVSNLLSPTDGAPVFSHVGSPRFITDATSFHGWYHDDPAVNQVIVNKLTLLKQPDDSYVFDSNTDAPYPSIGGFFPLDGLGLGNYPGWTHNFHFTSEVRDVFTFAGGEVLEFRGDDDVFVFINGHLVVDLGGVHGASPGSVTLSTTLMDLGDPNAVPPVPPQPVGLTVGGMYEFAVFQAERHTSESNYKLTLRGFVKQRTSCAPVCGDGIKTKTEVCDEIPLSTDYGKCAPGCVRGPHCGDAIPQAPQEECDDGVNLTPWTPAKSTTACAPSCHAPVYCGDGIIQGIFNEKCDKGPENTDDPVLSYNGCKTNCQVGPRCGDGVAQSQFGEECDNGFNISSYVQHPSATDCAPQCKKPHFCGDGVVDFPFEQCDRGNANTNDGSYNSCTVNCQLGPRCGDHIKQTPQEQCDDGNRINGDGCSAACLDEGTIPK